MPSAYRKGAAVVAGLAASLAIAAPASAAVIVWDVTGTFTVARPPPSIVAGPTPSFSRTANQQISSTVSAGSLSGTFTTDVEGDDVTVTEVDLKVTASGGYQAFEYTTGMIDWVSVAPGGLLQYFRMTDPTGMDQLQLWFGDSFDPDVAAPIAVSGYDHQSVAGGNRMLNGLATPEAVAGVPEPQTWALLIAGFGLSGLALRRRRGEPSLA